MAGASVFLVPLGKWKVSGSRIDALSIDFSYTVFIFNTQFLSSFPIFPHSIFDKHSLASLSELIAFMDHLYSKDVFPIIATMWSYHPRACDYSQYFMKIGIYLDFSSHKGLTAIFEVFISSLSSLMLWQICNQEINSEFSSSPKTLQMFVIMTGISYFIFANLVPTMSAMRNWLATSAILMIIYDVTLFGILVKDGAYFSSLFLATSFRYLLVDINLKAEFWQQIFLCIFSYAYDFPREWEQKQGLQYQWK